MHKEFAEIYDIFMKHVDYDKWYEFLNCLGFGMWNWRIFMAVLERWIFCSWSRFIKKNVGNI